MGAGGRPRATELRVGSLLLREKRRVQSLRAAGGWWGARRPWLCGTVAPSQREAPRAVPSLG